MSGSDPEQPPPPHEPYGPGQQNPYGAPPPYQQPYGQQPPYGQPYYQQPGYGQPPYAFTPPPPSHPSATTSMVLGIIGLAGVLTCAGLTLVLSPFAWAMGSRAVKEIDAAPPGSYSGREQANAGRITGIIGTVLLILGILAIIALVVLAVVAAESSTYE